MTHIPYFEHSIWFLGLHQGLVLESRVQPINVVIDQVCSWSPETYSCRPVFNIIMHVAYRETSFPCTWIVAYWRIVLSLPQSNITSPQSPRAEVPPPQVNFIFLRLRIAGSLGGWNETKHLFVLILEYLYGEIIRSRCSFKCISPSWLEI